MNTPMRASRHISRGTWSNRIRAWRDERGSGTVLATGLIGVLALICCMILLVGSAYAAKSRAQTAADLAALAGAQVVIDSIDMTETEAASSACEMAANVAKANGASISQCQIDSSGRVDVDVLVNPQAVPGPFASLLTPASAHAQAGRPGLV